MTTLSSAKVRDRFGELLNRVGYGRERIVIERHGRRVAALISAEDLDLLQALEDRFDLASARAARAEPGAIPLAQVKARLGL